MNQTQMYICIHPWARNKKGDIIEKWLLNRYPPEVKGNFEPYTEQLVESPVAKKVDTVSTKPVTKPAVTDSNNTAKPREIMNG